MKVIFNVLYIKINSLILFISTKKIFFSSFSSTPSAENELYLFNINLIKASLFSLSIEDFKNTSIILYAIGLYFGIETSVSKNEGKFLLEKYLYIESFFIIS